MPHIEVSDEAYQRIELLAAAWHTTLIGGQAHEPP